MKIIKVTMKEFEEVETDEGGMNLYRRLEPEVWEHWLGESHGWHPYRFFEFLEIAYSEWQRNSNEKI